MIIFIFSDFQTFNDIFEHNYKIKKNDKEINQHGKRHFISGEKITKY